MNPDKEDLIEFIKNTEGMKNKKRAYRFYKTVSEEHNGKYSYKKASFAGWQNSLTIICPDHGEFNQTATNHLSHGCKKCAHIQKGKNKKKKSADSFLEKAKERYGDIYDYSKTVYKGFKEPVTIICKEHGEFNQTPTSHLRGVIGCEKCRIEKQRAEFIKASTKIHGSKYDYSKLNFKGYGEKKVIIVCREHGPFLQRASSHKEGHGCPECRKKTVGRKKLSTEEYIKRAKEIHRNKYDYSQTIYRGSTELVTIICPEHGPFKKKAAAHVYNFVGCPECK